MSAQGYAFFFDATRCSGCKTCMMACKDFNDLDPRTTYRNVYEYTGGETLRAADGSFSTTCFSYAVSIACCHCERPACMGACPTGAMHRDARTGLVCVDAGRCIGCGGCERSCPYGAPTVDRALGHAVKCDGCAERVARGLLPVCVDSCPARALDFGPAEAMARKGDIADIAPLPSPAITRPRLYVKGGDDRAAAGSGAGAVANRAEIQ